ncbi:cytochrome P450 [Zopfia rhizophila CBS 207.26]|uniref:Cytochrome P450 n=1 Tax=Zopfia rhizophila CBS 207.26 TaxID=1314779 RepID=A0A6A6DTS9_9PEZI|nr:cytochrome P450 [Zopfia rhizophila CBS 207.26]
MEPNLVTAYLCLVACFILFYIRPHTPQNVREPPLIATPIPFLTPLFGFAKMKVKYLVELRNKYQHAIYTLRLPFQKIYVVNSPQLISAIERFKPFRFLDISVEAMIRICGISKEARKILRAKLDGVGDDVGLAYSLFKGVHNGLSQGKDVDSLTRTAIRLLAPLEHTSLPERRLETGLYDLIFLILIPATTDAVYGPFNPFRDPAIRDSYRVFENGFGGLIFGLLPSLTARGALRARDRIVFAFEKYYTNSYHLEASQLIQSLFSIYTAHGLQVAEIAKLEITTACVALLSNTLPGAFWLIYHIYSDQEILEKCRAEVEECVIRRYYDDETTTPIRLLKMSQFKEKTPMLHAVWSETLRVHSGTISTRYVASDTILDSQYLVKKGSIVMIPTPVVHTDDRWGPNPPLFNHQRWLQTDGKLPALRAFGGGSTLCPGRHYASDVILTLAAMFVMRFEIEAVDGWVEPDTRKAHLGSGVLKPDGDLDVAVKVREKGEGRWDVEFD